MKILVVGGGGREHAIAKSLARNDSCRIFAVMSKKNPGIAALTEEVLIAPETDILKVISFCTRYSIEYAFIGPEAPLDAGIVDALTNYGIKCVGPMKDAAKIETDKTFCRNLMKKYAIPGLPEYHIFHNGKDAEVFLRSSEENYAIKPAGLTGGKGVRIMGEHLDLEQACAYVLTLAGSVVIEECLHGEEFTLQAFTDGVNLVPISDFIEAYTGKPQIRFTAHQHCGAATYVFVKDNKIVPINRMIDVDSFFGSIERLTKQLESAGPISRKMVAINGIRELLSAIKKSEDGGKDLWMSLGKALISHNYDSLRDFHWNALFIGTMHFMDNYNYDVERVSQCCIHYATPDGTLIPFCSYNSGPVFREQIWKKYSKDSE